MSACSIKVRGVVQGVGFRPFVFRLARANTLAGWVLNGKAGVEIFLEGPERNLKAFIDNLRAAPPPAAQIMDIEVRKSEPAGMSSFTIRESCDEKQPTTRISPDLPVCDDCLHELFDTTDPRYQYPYINCTNCGPRYSVTTRLPYDRPNTTMEPWRLDEFCARQYADSSNRRFHAQPVACGRCGPAYYLLVQEKQFKGADAISGAAEVLRRGKIVAVKGLGGYHLACDARNSAVIEALRERKYRKEKPFALMVRSVEEARELVELSGECERLLLSMARPIVICPARSPLTGVAPGSDELGIMLPYTPLHYLLFEAGAPSVLVMTSGNRSNEPIAYEDADAFERLAGIADAFLAGERPIARRVDDSVVRAGVFGTSILRRSRGYAPRAVANVPASRPILALGADLKNSITLVVEGQAFVSQHIGDLSDYGAFQAFEQTVEDLLSMYEVDRDELLVAHDQHPQYASTVHARGLKAFARIPIQHHRAHIASVLAERGEWAKPVLGVSFDGTGYGDDESTWGGEFFAGSVRGGFERVAHLRRAALPGGDAAAQYPVQAAAGFLAQLEGMPDLHSYPFFFPPRFHDSIELVSKGVRTFATTSVGRLFDAAAAILGFTRGISFEGQAAIWLEQLAKKGSTAECYQFPFVRKELDFRPLLQMAIEDRAKGREANEIARAFQRGVARGLAMAITESCKAKSLDTVVLSGGVFQNELLLKDLHSALGETRIAVWTNHHVPPNDGGISLGQAALTAFSDIENQAGGVPHA